MTSNCKEASDFLRLQRRQADVLIRHTKIHIPSSLSVKMAIFQANQGHQVPHGRLPPPARAENPHTFTYRKMIGIRNRRRQ